MPGKSRELRAPSSTDYRDPSLAETMKYLGCIKRFEIGISNFHEIWKSTAITDSSSMSGSPPVVDLEVRSSSR